MEFTCRNGSVVSLRKLSVLVVAAFILFVTRRLFFLFLFLLISTFHRFGSVDHHSCQPVTSTLVVIKTDVTIKWQTTALPSHRQTQICLTSQLSTVITKRLKYESDADSGDTYWNYRRVISLKIFQCSKIWPSAFLLHPETLINPIDNDGLVIERHLWSPL